jgi:hypothetical protein
MAKRTDWLPGTRVGQLAKAKTWIEVLTLKATLWGVPIKELNDPDTGLVALTAEASSALAVAMSTERTVTSTAHCTMAFTALVEKMRYLKRLYFNCPPRTLEDMAALGLLFPDTTHTTTKTPVNQPGIEVIHYAPHVLTIGLSVASIIDAEETGYGIRVHSGLVPIGVLPTGERPTASFLATNTHVLSSPPLTTEDLPDSFFTRRKKDLVKLPEIASGMACHLAGCYENGKGGTAGPFGPMIKVFVP